MPDKTHNPCSIIGRSKIQLTVKDKGWLFPICARMESFKYKWSLKLSRFLRPNNTIHCDDPRQDSSSDSSLWIPINSPERNSRVDASLTVSAVEHWSSPLNQGSSVQSSKEISIFSFLFFLSTVSYVITARIYLRTYVCIIYTRFMRVRMYIHTETKYTL